MLVDAWNVNGLRAAHRKGFGRWLTSSKAAVVAVQEVRAHPDQIPAPELDGIELQCLGDHVGVLLDGPADRGAGRCADRPGGLRVGIDHLGRDLAVGNAIGPHGDHGFHLGDIGGGAGAT